MSSSARPSRLHHTGTMSNSAADTADTVPPRLVGKPLDGHAADAPLVFTFSEAIKLGPNASLIIRIGYGPGQSEPLTGNPAVTISGATLTWTPSKRLAYGASYTIEFSPGTILDLAGNSADNGWFISTSFRAGYSPVTLNLTGTPGADFLDGGDRDDILDGGAGGDRLTGHGGDDLLLGGDDAGATYPGQDRLDGGDGNDTLWGGGGDDTLDGGSGNDKLYGEAGDDSMEGGAGDDLLEGGAGNDSLRAVGGASILRGGDGNDDLRVYSWVSTGLLDGGDGNDTLSGFAGLAYAGGAGDDRFEIAFDDRTTGTTSASGDAGADSFFLRLWSMKAGKATLSGGAGIDTWVPSTTDFASIPDATITDFTPGAGGDQIDLRQVYIPYPSGNPFDDGSLRLAASGADTLFQVRQLATGNYVTVLTLAGVAPSQLVAANFVDGFNPLGGTIGLALVGTAGADRLTGTRLDDTLSGLGGNDELSGGKGNDLLEGGDGNDKLFGEEGNDTLRGGDGDDQMWA
ncbi:MAG: Ig-like domain-containing protein, partial [Telluria sp.]